MADSREGIPSPLLRLSAELRNFIYEYALTASSAIDLAENGPEPALTRTCRWIRHETHLLYYSVNSFTLQIPPDQCRAYAARFAASHFSERLQSVRRLEIVYCLSSSENQPTLSGGFQQEPMEAWRALAEVLARAGVTQGQFRWKAICATTYDEVGRNSLAWMAGSGRVWMYQQMMEQHWEKAVDRFGRQSLSLEV